MRGRRWVLTSLVAAVGLLLAACSGPISRSEPNRTEPANTIDDVELAGGEAGRESTERNSDDSTVSPDRVAGPGVLVDASVELGIDEALLGIRGHAVAAADVNGDGWVDLFVGTFADRPTESYQVRGATGPAPDRLLLGSPDGFSIDERFEPAYGRTAGATFADLDGDGDPDLVVSRNVRSGERQDAPSEVYRNDDGELVPASVLDAERGGRAVGATDLDNDGRPDLVLVEDRWSGGSTALFRNEGDLRFSEVTAEMGFPSDVWGLGLGIGDLDGDGDDDLVIGGSNRVFLAGDRGFEEAAGSPLPWTLKGDEDDPAHVLIDDLDADGDADVLIGQHFNSTVDLALAEPVRLFRNDGSAGQDDPTLIDDTDAAGLPPLPTKSPQILFLDLDDDGVRDVVLTASLATDDDHLPLVLRHRGDSGAGPLFDGSLFEAAGFEVPDGIDAHYWIDGVVLDANGDGRDDLFMVEWEPALGSRLFLNLPAEQ